MGESPLSTTCTLFVDAYQPRGTRHLSLHTVARTLLSHPVKTGQALGQQRHTGWDDQRPGLKSRLRHVPGQAACPPSVSLSSQLSSGDYTSYPEERLEQIQRGNYRGAVLGMLAMRL